MNNYQRHDTAQQLADTQSPYYMAKLLIEEREQKAALLTVLIKLRTDLRKTGGCIDTTTLGEMQRAIVSAGGGE